MIIALILLEGERDAMPSDFLHLTHIHTNPLLIITNLTPASITAFTIQV